MSEGKAPGRSTPLTYGNSATSITGNTALTEGSVVDLLDRLDGCENPYACPHGRPVIVEFDSDELEARFERDYPGHR